MLVIYNAHKIYLFLFTFGLPQFVMSCFEQKRRWLLLMWREIYIIESFVTVSGFYYIFVYHINCVLRLGRNICTCTEPNVSWPNSVKPGTNLSTETNDSFPDWFQFSFNTNPVFHVSKLVSDLQIYRLKFSYFWTLVYVLRAPCTTPFLILLLQCFLLWTA